MTEQARGHGHARVLIVLPGLSAGGTERVVNFLANGWARRGWRVDVAAFEEQTAASYYAYDDAVRLVRLGTPVRPRRLPVAAISVLKRAASLRKLMATTRPDVVISFLTRTNITTLLSATGLPIPIIVSERNNAILQPAGPFWGWLRDRLYPRSSALVTMTKGSMDVFRRRMDVSGWIIPNPVDLPSLSRASGTGRRLVATGRLVSQKGFDILLRAFAQVAPDFLDWQLVIWGEGPERLNLERQRDELGLGGRVQMPGVSDRPGSWIEAADAFVLSSRFEGWGIVLLEAMAAGLPAVSFDCDFGPSDMITPDVDGILVPNGDERGLALALARLMSDAALRARFGEAAALKAKDYSPERILDMWSEVVMAAIAQRPSKVSNRPSGMAAPLTADQAR